MNGPRGSRAGRPGVRRASLGLGAGEIAVHDVGQGQVHVRDRLVGLEPHRVNVVVACWGLAGRGRLEVGNGGIEVAAQPGHGPGQGLDRRAEPLPALPEAHSQRLEHLRD